MFRINVYFRIKAKNLKEKTYLRMCGDTENGYTQEIRSYMEKAIKEKLHKEGYEDVHLFPCSENEAISGFEDSENPLGYVDIFARVHMLENGEEKTVYMKTKKVFYKYFDQSMFEDFVEDTKTYYNETGEKGHETKIVKIEQISKEEYVNDNLHAV